MSLVSVSDFISFYILLELVSLTFYILVLAKLHNKYTVEAATKYFILGSFASGILIYGVSLIYGITGTTN